MYCTNNIIRIFVCVKNSHICRFVRGPLAHSLVTACQRDEYSPIPLWIRYHFRTTHSSECQKKNHHHSQFHTLQHSCYLLLSTVDYYYHHLHASPWPEVIIFLRAPCTISVISHACASGHPAREVHEVCLQRYVFCIHDERAVYKSSSPSTAQPKDNTCNHRMRYWT